jgi:tetratricopeptide (TPR) repeat protein
MTVKRALVILAVLLPLVNAIGESVADIDARAQRFYSEKRFSEAIREWLSALDIDPTNEKIQQKVEMVYEEKHRKNMAFERSKMLMREVRQKADTAPIDEIERGTKDAVDNFVIAYRIDPNDPDVRALRDKMEKFQRDMLVELEKKRRSEEDKRNYMLAVTNAKLLMDQEKYSEALAEWQKALDLFKDDAVAKEGYRKTELAINNRLKYERVKALMLRGNELFAAKNYNDSIVEFRQVLMIDPKNDEAEGFISRIEDILDGQRNAERKRQQAEQFYQEGLDDLANYRFNEARDSFESALSLVPKYKDAEFRIQSIKKLRDDYAERMRRAKQASIEKEFENGIIYFSDGRYKEALSSFEKTVVLDPSHKLAANYLEKTKEALREKQEEEVDSSSPYYDLVSSLIVSGKDLYNKGRYLESRERWDKIRSLFPNNRLAVEYILRCDLKLDNERFKSIATRVIDEGKEALAKRDGKKALSRFEMIKSIDPNYPGIDALIASVKVKGRVIQPVPAGGSAVPVDPDEVERRYQAGIALYRKGGEQNLKAALDQFKWIAQNDPDNTKALIVMNKIDVEIRFAAGTPVAETGPRLTDNQKKLVSEYYFRGISYYSSNNYDKAIEEWRKVLAIDPTHEKAKNNIRKCLALLKQ